MTPAELRQYIRDNRPESVVIRATRGDNTVDLEARGVLVGDLYRMTKVLPADTQIELIEES